MTQHDASPGGRLEADHRRLDAILAEAKRLLREGAPEQSE